MEWRGLAAVALATGFVVWAIDDFNDWKSLGAGGFEHNIQSWVKVTAARALKRDPLDTTSLGADIGTRWDVRTLETLPPREGGRPQIARHPVPHRQLSQVENVALARLLHSYLEELAENDAELKFDVSHTERHNRALWAADVNQINPQSKNNGEIAHVHPIDGSVHVILSPSDAATVIEAGWGELHSLAGIDGILPPPTYVLLYSARNLEELELLKQVVRAAVAYTTFRPMLDDEGGV
jgi:hypothetical protein